MEVVIDIKVMGKLFGKSVWNKKRTKEGVSRIVGIEGLVEG